MTGTTDDRRDPRLGYGTDESPVAQNDVYLVMSAEDRAKGFVRPYRNVYEHSVDLGGCGAVTTMGDALSETYAADPRFYGATYCVGCRMHRPVGDDGEFTWRPDGSKVGT